MADDFDLDVGYIGKGIDRQLQIGVHSEGNNQQRKEDDHPFLPQRISN